MSWMDGWPTANTLNLLLTRGASAADVASYLAGLDAARCRSQILGLRADAIVQLFRCFATSPYPPAARIVPDGMRAGATLVFDGRNTLPVFRRFQKRFSRTADGLVFGYNHASMPGQVQLTTPGYFRVDDTADQHMVFDYDFCPPFEPEGWPTYRPNSDRLGRIIYHGMRDHVYPVVDKVFVGSARRGSSERAFFVLVSASWR